MTAPLAVDVVRVRPGCDPLPLPRYMTPGAAGMDLLADLEAEIVLAPGDRRLVPTGLAVAIPAGFEGQVRARSGLAARDGLTVLNAPGTIDADYRGEVRVLLVNLGRQPVSVRHGDRIAQLVVAPVARVVWREVTTLPESVRGAGGFGSTGDPGQRSVRGGSPGASPSEAEPSRATGSGAIGGAQRAERASTGRGVGGSPSEAEPSRATGSGAIGGAQRAERASTGRGPRSD